MKKIDPFGYSAPPVVSKTKTFTDPLHPGEEIGLDLHVLDMAEQYAVADYTQSMIERYVGSPANKVEPQMTFPPVGGKRIPMGPTICRNAATLLFMQNGSLEEKYTFEQIVAMSITWPSAWVDIAWWIKTLNEGEPPNDLGEEAEASVTPPSTAA